MHPFVTPPHSGRHAPPFRRRRHLAPVWIWRMLAAAVLALGLGACAGTARRAAKPVSIDARPTPQQPAPAGTVQAPAPETGPATAPRPAPSAATIRSRFAADTLAAHAVLERCGQRRLLPDQESTVDSARELLFDARSAALRGDLPRAESLARQARQLTSSLDCR